jgi:hypothetical protein
MSDEVLSRLVVTSNTNVYVPGTAPPEALRFLKHTKFPEPSQPLLFVPPAIGALNANGEESTVTDVAPVNCKAIAWRNPLVAPPLPKNLDASTSRVTSYVFVVPVSGVNVEVNV